MGIKKREKPLGSEGPSLLEMLVLLVIARDVTVTLKKDHRVKKMGRVIVIFKKGGKRVGSFYLTPISFFSGIDRWMYAKEIERKLEELRDESEHSADACAETGDATGDPETDC